MMLLQYVVRKWSELVIRLIYADLAKQKKSRRRRVSVR